MTYLGALYMFFKRLRAMHQAKARFDALTKEGVDPYEAGDRVLAEMESEGIDPATIMAIIALIQMLIELFSKK